MEEAEGALEAEENKVLRAALELGQTKQEIDRRIAEKEEEFNNTRYLRYKALSLKIISLCLFCRKNHGRAMESMQASMETEQKAKAEALRIKKKLEGDINEFEIALDHANKANNEALKSIKRYSKSNVKLKVDNFKFYISECFILRIISLKKLGTRAS